ncbi:MAG: ATP-binding cassette domain-containing protein [Saprospiraceae bacterium]|nr:ATP-binding cassette domain-containing protein [Saprospiraceae bacterium]
MEVLQTSHLHKSYGKIKAVNDLNLNIHQGMVFGLLGPNGSGKTTTLGIILGILQFDAGNFTWFENQYGEKHRTRIGAILETPNFYPYLNAIDNLKIVSLIKGVEDTNYDDFFDEPTNGLDPQGIAEVRQILKRIADTGKTVIMASHILDEVEKICSHVGIMKNGVLLASGPVGAMLNDKLLGEIGSDDLIALTAALNDIQGVTIGAARPKFIECTVDASISASKINRMLAEKNIYVNHLVLRKQRLEEEFLEITRKQNSVK